MRKYKNILNLNASWSVMQSVRFSTHDYINLNGAQGRGTNQLTFEHFGDFLIVLISSIQIMINF